MASRENQGLQIAVMIFFLLVVLLSVTTYVFFKSADEQRKKVDALDEKNRELTASANSAQDEINEIKQLIGFPIDANFGDEENPAEGTILAGYNADMEKYAAGIEEGKQNYRDVLDILYAARQERAEAEAKARDEVQGLKTAKESAEKTHENRIASFDGSIADIKNQYEADVARLKEERKSIEEKANQVSALLETKRTQFTDYKAEKEATIEDLGKQVDKLTQLVSRLRERNEQTEVVAGLDSPDGKVTYVHQRTNVVWINLGQDDLLNRQTKFSVYPVDGNNLAIENKKGSIEVTRIIDRHMAEARITNFDVADPIVPGDVIHSPVWERGRREGFALAGFIDIDGDRRSDREKVRELIRLNGGRVDVEVDDEGATRGKLKLTTRKLILGEQPTDKTKAEIREAFGRLIDEAQEIGIPKVSVQKFVNQMGWQPDERTVPLGKGAQSKDFPAQRYEGQRSSTGNTSGKFQPRQRPASTY